MSTTLRAELRILFSRPTIQYSIDKLYFILKSIFQRKWRKRRDTVDRMYTDHAQRPEVLIL